MKKIVSLGDCNNRLKEKDPVNVKVKLGLMYEIGNQWVRLRIYVVSEPGM